MELAALRRDQDARVDYEVHGSPGTDGRFHARTPASTSSMYFGSSSTRRVNNSASSRTVHDTGPIGPMRATGVPARSMMYSARSSRTRSINPPSVLAAAVAEIVRTPARFLAMAHSTEIPYSASITVE